MPDDLNTPLGKAKRKKRPELPIALPKAIAGVLALFIVAVVAWAALVDDPFGGEPMVVAAASPPPPVKTADAPPGTENPARYDGPPAAAAPATPSGSKTINIIDGASGKSQQVTIPAPGENKQAAKIDQKMLETTRHGPVPRIAADGSRSSTVYARALKMPPGKADAPRIAIVINGLGISASGSNEALTKLPGAVTFSFAPYGNDIDKLVSRARDAEHEVLLQAPMEPFDYPDNDPGPQTLLTSLTADQNVDRLQWLMSRFQGYVGISNYMGARFTASESALMPVLRETAKRGLIFFDDGTSPRSLAGQMAGGVNLPFAKAEIVLDAVPTPVEIDRALGRLEMQARDRGVAVGIATALPVTIARIADWAKKVEGRGFVLVPITSVAIKAKSS